MSSSRPYLMRALYEWINDQYLTPYIVVDAQSADVVVPVDLVQNGSIVFNISEEAVGRLKISNEAIEFDASFSGVVRHIYAPISAVMAIYAQENGSGMMFAETGVPGEEEGFEPGVPPVEIHPKETKVPHLRLVTTDSGAASSSDSE